MNRIINTTIAALALSLTGAAALAQNTQGPIARAQVQAELAADLFPAAPLTGVRR